MKKGIVWILAFCFLFLIGCGKTQTLQPTDAPSDPQTASAAPSVSESGAETESFSEPEVSPVIREGAKGVFYGENTGTDKTFTGLEPLPLSDFGQPSFENTRGLSDTTIEHSYGVAENETPHNISINNQKFFDENGYKAICYDSATDEKIVYLTFDCGYENGYTAKILDTLRDKGVKAAFFCTKPEMEQNSDLIARMINEGHIVGNHSVTHPDFSSLTREEMYAEVKGFDDYLREHFGFSAQYFRYPQGKYSENSLAMLNEMGYTCVFWSLAYADWDLEDQPGADHALETVMSRIHPGAVILLHAISPDNANALPDIIDAARAAGYDFRTLPEYRS